MAKSVLILGGGFGGISAANRLREVSPETSVTLVDRGTRFAMGFRKTGEVVGRDTIADGSRPLEALTAKGVRVVRGTIDAIDPAARAAVVDGARLDADALVVALGAETVPGAIPGLAEHGFNVWDFPDVPRAADALRSAGSARVVVGIFGAPYKCSPAPFELAILVREAFAECEVSVFSPLPASLPVLGPAGCSAIEGRLAGLGIGFRANTKAERVEAGAVVVEGGERIGFDVLLAVPPHRVPVAVSECGLAPAGGWVKVNPKTLATTFEGVYAVGDVTAIMMDNGQPMPKAGAFADAAGIVAAEQIAASFGGPAPSTFKGEGACFLEVGGGEAMLVRGNFLAPLMPEVELTPASKEAMDQKAEFERSRLDAWFGAAG